VKTRCPGCATIFRVTPEQLKVRAGKVRCGQCQFVFNALDGLLEETRPATALPTTAEWHAPACVDVPILPTSKLLPVDVVDILLEPLVDNKLPAAEALSDAAAEALAKASGLIVPRETTEIPGYSKWAEGVMSSPSLPSAVTNTRWPFTLVTVFLLLALISQLVFYFRSEIAVALPGTRNLLAEFSEALGSKLPLPRQAELVSIETSDLQADPSRGNLLILQSTLRNRAAYAQAYPSLELSLTDTQDNAIARRVFQPGEYLDPKSPPDQIFGANAEITVRLWIEVSDITAAGYRLYIFYPS
jgi:predicted Zn finger-like uncharacterized protein